ncbi:MAG TPA: hypothetical protein VJ506_02335 [Candidatus Limnocylindrales bacterium]|nr:hypothetical protein [Candidatus Limnocylindrales bacterium]
MIDDRVRAVLRRWLDFLIVSLVVVLVVVLLVSFLWDPTTVHNTISPKVPI